MSDMSEFEEIPVLSGGKRLGVQWCPWMGDWHTSWSPRNGNSNAEGPWDQWVDLAIKILQHPATKLTRPEVAEAAAGFVVKDYYDAADRYLTDDEIETLFRSGGGS